jgi:hypothetical protein
MKNFVGDFAMFDPGQKLVQYQVVGIVFKYEGIVTNVVTAMADHIYRLSFPPE